MRQSFGGASILESIDYARLVVDVADDSLAEDIAMLDLREISSFADFFVIMTADSPRQIKSLIEEIDKAVKEKGGRRHHIEGAADSGWVLIDFSDVIVHIFAPEQREFYQLEEAWSDAPETVRIQ